MRVIAAALNQYIFKVFMSFLGIVIVLLHDPNPVLSFLIILSVASIDLIKNRNIITVEMGYVSKFHNLYINPRLQVRYTGIIFLLIIGLFPLLNNRLDIPAEWAVQNVGILGWRYGIESSVQNIDAISYSIVSQIFLAFLTIVFATVSVLSMTSRRREYLANVDQGPAKKRAESGGAPPEFLALLVIVFFTVGASWVPLGGPAMCSRCPSPDRFIDFVLVTFFWFGPLIFIHYYVVHVGLRLSESQISVAKV